MHELELYGAFKRKEILTEATACMTLADITLSDISRIQKDTYDVTHSYEVRLQSKS